MKQAIIIILAVIGSVLISTAINLSLRPQMWVEQRGDRIAVVATTPDQKKFDIILFDRAIIDNADYFIGVDITKSPMTLPGTRLGVDH